MRYATDIPWETQVVGPMYGTEHTYRKAAEWLKDCRTVADWGGCLGYTQKFLPTTVDYIVVDGTWHESWPVKWRVVDLAKYHEQTEGILLRHVLEMTHDWEQILRNAVKAFTKRMVVVTFTPRCGKTHHHTNHVTWPVYHFNHNRDLIPWMQPHLVQMEYIKTTVPERIYFLEKK